VVWASDDHELLDEVGPVFFLQIDTFVEEILERSVHDLHRAIDDELTSIDLGLSLLDLEQWSGDFGRIWNFHDLHADDFDATDLAAILDQLTHASSDELAVGDEAGLLHRAEGELPSDASEDFQRLVFDEGSLILDRVRVGNRVDDAEV
jgi:hypothetical protein